MLLVGIFWGAVLIMLPPDVFKLFPPRNSTHQRFPSHLVIFSRLYFWREEGIIFSWNPCLPQTILISNKNGQITEGHYSKAIHQLSSLGICFPDNIDALNELKCRHPQNDIPETGENIPLCLTISTELVSSVLKRNFL